MKRDAAPTRSGRYTYACSYGCAKSQFFKFIRHSFDKASIRRNRMSLRQNFRSTNAPVSNFNTARKSVRDGDPSESSPKPNDEIDHLLDKRTHLE